eukprot:COSAG01_NODE_35821_length_526_cov_0.864169_1_plen_20_part_01
MNKRAAGAKQTALVLCLTLT